MSRIHLIFWFLFSSSLPVIPQRTSLQPPHRWNRLGQQIHPLQPRQPPRQP